MATHSSVLAWRIPGTGEPGGLPSMGSHRVGHDWSDLAAAAAAGSISFLPGEIVLNYVLLFRISFLPLAQGLDLRSIFKKPVFFFFFLSPVLWNFCFQLCSKEKEALGFLFPSVIAKIIISRPHFFRVSPWFFSGFPTSNHLSKKKTSQALWYYICYTVKPKVGVILTKVLEWVKPKRKIYEPVSWSHSFLLQIVAWPYQGKQYTKWEVQKERHAYNFYIFKISLTTFYYFR